MANAFSEKDDLKEALQRTQDQLIQSEKLASIGQLAAGIAHEINNPVGYINSNISAMERHVSDLLKMVSVYEAAENSETLDGKTLESIQETKRQIDLDYIKEDIVDLINESKEGIERVKKIVRDLKDFSHVGEEEWQWSDLHEGLDSTLNIVNNEIKYKAEVVKDYGALPEVNCIPSQINQVFMNILINAAQAIEDKGVITIRTLPVDDDWVCIEISDTGCGIEPDHINRIFESFFTTKPVGKGTGLGLSLSYNIIKKHDGHINVSSEKGVGTTFSVSLPIRKSEADKQAV